METKKKKRRKKKIKIPLTPDRRNNGTRVHSHERTMPNKTKKDNYSHSGNTNPNTGRKGYKK